MNNCKITFFDIETTGLDSQKDRIIQIGVISDGVSMSMLVNPGRPIPPEVTELTGIKDSDVADADPFPKIAEIVKVWLSDTVLVGFGCNGFDVPMLAEEFERAKVNFKWPTVIDAGTLFKVLEPRNLAAAVQFYCQKPHTDAHGALADAKATRDVFLAQLAKYERLSGLEASELALMSNYDRKMADPAGKLAYIDGVLCFNTFRNKGVPVKNDLGYAEWILRSDFPMATCVMIREELKAVYESEHTIFDDAEEACVGYDDEDSPF